MLFLTPRASTIIPGVLSGKRIGLHPGELYDNLSGAQDLRQGKVLRVTDMMNGEEIHHTLGKDLIPQLLPQ